MGSYPLNGEGKDLLMQFLQLNQMDTLGNTEYNILKSLQQVIELRKVLMISKKGGAGSKEYMDAEAMHELQKFTIYIWNGNESPEIDTGVNAKINQGDAAIWFKSQGFSEGELNELDVKTLKSELGKIIGRRNYLHRSLSQRIDAYLVTCYFNAGSALSCLLLLGSSLENPELQTLLTNIINEKFPGKGGDFVTEIRRLTDNDGPTRKLVGAAKGKGLCPLNNAHLQPGRFTSTDWNLLWNTITDICSVIEVELPKIEDSLKGIEVIQPKSEIAGLLTSKGFDMTGAPIDCSTYTNKIEALIAGGSPFDKVCGLVKAYNGCSEEDGTRRSSEKSFTKEKHDDKITIDEEDEEPVGSNTDETGITDVENERQDEPNQDTPSKTSSSPVTSNNNSNDKVDKFKDLKVDWGRLRTRKGREAASFFVPPRGLYLAVAIVAILA
ncbi:hypothetical protein BgAZ_100360 [Babesia gibsoni]|uniref:Uncharacterized protein n=1 Tax=Babesia gibsoni TaxID=33632 RepID=A0AAD8UR36_BABGI|nr:hypothetical protein BgAZ_100360 [Babesia gibsoni]